MAQIENQGTLNPYAHMFLNLVVGEQPAVVPNITTQISLKAGIKQ